MSAQAKTIVTHLTGVFAGAVAALSWAATQGVDLYHLWNQLNDVVVAITKFVATATPLITTGYAIYRTAAKQRIQELASDPNAVKAAAAIPLTPEVEALADALKK